MKRSCNYHLGHGQCESYPLSSGQYIAKCQCNVGFGGSNCEHPTGCNRRDDGSPPCLNGGRCTAGQEGYHCQCPESYVGKSKRISPKIVITLQMDYSDNIIISTLPTPITASHIFLHLIANLSLIQK